MLPGLLFAAFVNARSRVSLMSCTHKLLGAKMLFLKQPAKGAIHGLDTAVPAGAGEPCTADSLVDNLKTSFVLDPGNAHSQFEHRALAAVLCRCVHSVACGHV
jgi:hypothetical protein